MISISSSLTIFYFFALHTKFNSCINTLKLLLSILCSMFYIYVRFWTLRLFVVNRFIYFCDVFYSELFQTFIHIFFLVFCSISTGSTFFNVANNVVVFLLSSCFYSIVDYLLAISQAVINFLIFFQIINMVIID